MTFAGIGTLTMDEEDWRILRGHLERLGPDVEIDDRSSPSDLATL